MMKESKEWAIRLIGLVVACVLFGVAYPARAAATDAPASQKQALILVSVQFGGPGIDQYVACLLYTSRCV